MEFFQTILTAVTTPNENLINILGIPLAYLDVFVVMLFFTTIMNISANRKQKIIYVIVYGTFVFTLNLIIPKQYTVFINILVWPFLIYFLLKTTIIKAILSEISIYVISSTLEALFINLISHSFNITLEQILTIPAFRISIPILIYIIIYLITLFIKYFKLNINIFENINKKTKIFIIFTCVLMVLILFTQFYLIMLYGDSFPISITIISIIGIIAYFFISICSIINSSKLEITERDLEGAQLTIHSQKVLHDTVRSFKHDFDNIVNSIGRIHTQQRFRWS